MTLIDGSALVYSSVKEEKNLDLLYKYIVHKTYGFHFNSPASVVEKDAVFIPAGWDNNKKIGILHENFTTVKPEDAYEDFIVMPPVRKVLSASLLHPALTSGVLLLQLDLSFLFVAGA
ncbi:hypothetical protein FKM82_027334 [Ascaphus truei]